MSKPRLSDSKGVPRFVPPGRGARLMGVLTHRPLYKLAALFFAIVLWIVVSAEETIEKTLVARVQLALEPGTRLADPLPTVRVRVAGRARELFKLTTRRPVVRRALGITTADQLQVELRASDVVLPPGVDASVRGVQPRSIAVRVVRDAVAVVVAGDSATNDSVPGDSAANASATNASATNASATNDSTATDRP